MQRFASPPKTGTANSTGTSENLAKQEEHKYGMGWLSMLSESYSFSHMHGTRHRTDKQSYNPNHGYRYK